MQEIIDGQKRFLALFALLKAATEMGIEWRRVRGAWPEWVDGQETGRVVALQLDDESNHCLGHAYACPWLEDSWTPETRSGSFAPGRYVYSFESQPCAAQEPAAGLSEVNAPGTSESSSAGRPAPT